MVHCNCQCICINKTIYRRPKCWYMFLDIIEISLAGPFTNCHQMWIYVQYMLYLQPIPTHMTVGIGIRKSTFVNSTYTDSYYFSDA